MRGLTTAASLWAVAAIGLAAGGGLYVASLATTVVILVILVGIKPIEEHFRERMQTRSLSITAKRGVLSIDTLREVTGERASRVRQFIVRQSGTEELDEVTISFVRLSKRSVDDIAERLRAHPDVTRVETEGR